MKGFKVQRFHLSFHVVAKPQRLKAGVDYVNARLASGVFRPLLDDKRFGLDRIADAYRHMESNEQIGKIIVTVR